MSKIFETPVYDGRLKEWRILNLNTGTVYSSKFKSIQDAAAAIDDGCERDGKTVTATSIREIYDLLSGR